jgi:flagellar hook-associated protein 2
MGTIASSGVGSGLDVAGLVQKLIQAEGQPKTLRLNTDEAKVQAKLSALGSLQSALASFRDTVGVLKNIDRFQGRQTTVSDPDFLSATAATTAVPGTYSVEVQQLASAQKLQSATFATPATAVGTGTLHIVTGGQAFDVTVDSANNTLAGIAAAINQSAAGQKVIASVISGAGDARLTIAARATGAANAMTITQSDGDGGLAGLVSGLTERSQALDARALIDGVVATSATNTVSGVIAGVDFTVKQENALGETTEVSVGYDTAGARKAIDDFVKSYNALLDAVKSSSSYDPTTKKGGPLFGDAGVSNIGYQLRRELTSSVAGLDSSFDVLGEIGVTAGLDGKLSVDGGDLDAAFADNFDAVGQLFAADGKGVAVKLDTLLGQYLSTDGIFQSRTASLKSSIDDIDDQRQALNDRLTELQARYTKQFNALDGLLAQMQSTSNFLTQQLGNLPGFAG